MAAVDSFDTKSFFFLFQIECKRGRGSAITPYVTTALPLATRGAVAPPATTSSSTTTAFLLNSISNKITPPVSNFQLIIHNNQSLILSLESYQRKEIDTFSPPPK